LNQPQSIKALRAYCRNANPLVPADYISRVQDEAVRDQLVELNRIVQNRDEES
jgi:hypothetical protein